MRIATKSPKGEIIYWLVVSLIPIGLGVYFIYDWSFGYEAQNRAQAQKDPILSSQPQLIEQAMQRTAPTDRDYKDLMAQHPTDPGQIRQNQRIGPPLLTRNADSGELIEYYPSRYGMLTVTSRAGRLADESIKWTDWKHTQAEIQAQLYWSIPCVVFLIWPLRRLILALTMRVELDDERLVYRGEVIRYGDMTDLRGYNPKGWIDLYYRKEGQPEPAMIRLDNQKISAFNEIVGAICEKNGYKNPLKEPEEAPGERADSTARKS